VAVTFERARDRMVATPGVLREEYLGHCRFVELKGGYGWQDG
jgi:hypothetical protein